MKLSDKKKVENEAVFRQKNEAIEQGLAELKEQAVEDKSIPIPAHEDLSLYFYCECADENCKERIFLTLSDYQKLHKNRRKFIVLPGHEVVEVEKVVNKKKQYSIVEKFIKPTENPTHLYKTNVSNV